MGSSEESNVTDDPRVRKDIMVVLDEMLREKSSLILSVIVEMKTAMVIRAATVWRDRARKKEKKKKIKAGEAIASGRVNETETEILAKTETGILVEIKILAETETEVLAEIKILAETETGAKRGIETMAEISTKEIIKTVQVAAAVLTCPAEESRQEAIIVIEEGDCC